MPTTTAFNRVIPTDEARCMYETPLTCFVSSGQRGPSYPHGIGVKSTGLLLSEYKGYGATRRGVG